MKRFALATVAVLGLMMIPAAAKADKWHGHGHGKGGHYAHQVHRHHHRDHHRHYVVPRVVRRPVIVQRPVVVPQPYYAPYYGAPQSGFYYNGPNMSFGIGF